MQIDCIHCGGAVAIAAEHLDRQAFCPHCSQVLILPREVLRADDADSQFSMRALFDNSISGLSSMVIHMAIIFILAYLQFGGSGIAGEGEDAFIGSLPGVELGEQSDAMASMDASTAAASETFSESAEDVAPSTDFATATSFDSPFSLNSSAMASGNSDFSSVSPGGASGGGGGGGSFEGYVSNLRRNGLDIVIVFDATGSMGGELDEVKKQVRRIGDTLIRLIPKARVGLVAYRDDASEFVVKGHKLSGNIQEADTFLAGIEAAYGGDRPEAVDKGLEWAIKQNSFRPEARKVILIFGDAPPHSATQKKCEMMAADFSAQQKGVVSTVTCRDLDTMPEFDAISQAGGGETFLTRESREIMTQLLVLVFGSKYRGKVLEAFEMMDR